MAKQIIIKDPDKDITYTLEYNRKSIETMERQGFIASEITDKPMTYLPMLFRGAFLAHHRFVKPEVIDALYAKLTRKDKLLEKLTEMYNEPVMTLLEEPEERAGNLDWTENG